MEGSMTTAEPSIFLTFPKACLCRTLTPDTSNWPDIPDEILKLRHPMLNRSR